MPDSATISSLFNVSGFVSAAQLLDSQNGRTGHSALLSEQRKMRNEIDFRDEGVNWTIRQ